MDRAGEGRRERLAAYLELHIEQGPVLEAEGLPCGAVLGTSGSSAAARWSPAAAAHAGLHADGPPRRRRRRGGAGDRRAPGDRPRHGGVCTAGRARLRAGHRHRGAGPRGACWSTSAISTRGALAAMRAEAERAFAAAAAEEGCRSRPSRSGGSSRCRSTRGWSTPPRTRAPARPGARRRLPSGALHDAAELARVVPGGDGVQLVDRRRQPRAGGGHRRGRPRARAGGLRRLVERVGGRTACREGGRVLIAGRVQGVGFRGTVRARGRPAGRGRLGAQPARRPRRGPLRGRRRRRWTRWWRYCREGPDTARVESVDRQRRGARALRRVPRPLTAALAHRSSPGRRDGA